MLVEKDFYAPLDPELLKAYSENNHQIQYEQADDIWALGVTSLCFLFNDDWRSFYDWSKKAIRFDKIAQSIQVMNNMGYPQHLVKMVSEMLDQNNYTRIRLPSMYEMLNRKGY